MRCALLASAFLLAALWPFGARAEETKEQDIELKSGQIISAVLRSVKEGGIEIELSGIPMQLTWDLLRGERLLDERKELVDDEKLASWQSFAVWCRDNALDDELKPANERIKELGGTPVGLDNPQPPETGPVKPEPPPAVEPQPGPEPKTRLSSIAIEFDGDKDFMTALKDACKEYKIPLKTSDAEATITISDYDMTELNHATFFGETISAKYQATCSITLADAAGKELAPAKGFDSGARESNTVDGAKRQCRDVMARAIANWLSVRVKPGK
ncbi:MAG: hypothetical protein HUU29_04300 [Planctomycetaceae bacterium]|nr:hypothetical protein [Planctomycetaceae bacterium]